jgi:hypothetical protein
VNRNPVALVPLAHAVIRQALEDLQSDDPELREDAEEFLFDDEQTGPLSLECWLIRTGCLDADAFRFALRRKLEREQRKAA